MMDSAMALLHSAAPTPGAPYGRASTALGLTIGIVRAGCHLGRRATGHRVRHVLAAILLARFAGGDGMYASRIQAHTCDDLAAFSLRSETPVPPSLEASLE